MKKIGLVDIDSRIPNLALMKISTYYKQKGYQIKFTEPQFADMYDKVFVSKVFPRSKLPLFPPCEIEIGGSGYDLETKLPDNIEYLKPDYSLYSNSDYSLGFTTRGCIRKCPFCIVPQKEGKIKVVAGLYDIWDKDHEKIVLLDNNILAMPKHFFKVTSQIKKENLIVDFNQGLDCRLLTGLMAKELKSLRRPILRFSFDNINYEKKVLQAISLLKKHGIERVMWYVLVGFDSTIREDLYRLNLLKKLDQRCYVQRYNYCKEKIYIPMARWANQFNIFIGMSFKQFINDPRNPSYYKKIFQGIV